MFRTTPALPSCHTPVCDAAAAAAAAAAVFIARRENGVYKGYIVASVRRTTMDRYRPFGTIVLLTLAASRRIIDQYPNNACRTTERLVYHAACKNDCANARPKSHAACERRLSTTQLFELTDDVFESSVTKNLHMTPTAAVGRH